VTRPYPYAPEHIGKRESSDGITTMTVHVSIGNSDNKLTQQEWSQFVTRTSAVVDRFAVQLYGWYFSLPDAPWQNAMCQVLVKINDLPDMRAQLTELRRQFKQDSVAWAETARTEFL
jgi:hypothetical protein